MIGQWLSDPAIKVLGRSGDRRERVQLLEPLVWLDSRGEEWWVPSGFKYDGASVPRVLWPLVGHPLDDRVLRAAGLHDWHCRVRDDDSGNAHRKFYEGLLADGVPGWRASLMYAGVRNFGPQYRRMEVVT